jgi:hypothetical protein
MNENFTSSLFMGVMFVLRCLIPLGILFGISYLLRRFQLVNDNSNLPPVEPVEDFISDEAEQTGEEESTEDAGQSPAPIKKKNTGVKKKSTPAKKKES